MLCADDRTDVRIRKPSNSLLLMDITSTHVEIPNSVRRVVLAQLFQLSSLAWRSPRMPPTEQEEEHPYHEVNSFYAGHFGSTKMLTGLCKA